MATASQALRRPSQRCGWPPAWSPPHAGLRRHLSDKSRQAWRWEVRLIYRILGLITLLTALLWLGASGAVPALGVAARPVLRLRDWQRVFGGGWGELLPAHGLAGVVPLRLPDGRLPGLLQKHFSRFLISTNGGQCISCGNCSNACEMGIDVKQYAQRGEPIVRPACMG
ncbi:hypothetical protein [Hymenobacter sp. BT491]|uniref:hypothetical protein n=1 Tax=Hymenobacter sp. BT491 TaxID=2766779 RepID=UPI001CA3F67D|nr:hypothetical protein [Hymenobacter sp. BT491]